MQDPIFSPYLDQLCKFFFLSSAVHQAVFCLLSALPFSGGCRRRDAGHALLPPWAAMPVRWGQRKLRLQRRGAVCLLGPL